MRALEALGHHAVVGVQRGAARRARGGVALQRMRDDEAARLGARRAARGDEDGDGAQHLLGGAGEAFVHAERPAAVRDEGAAVAREAERADPEQAVTAEALEKEGALGGSADDRVRRGRGAGR